MSSSPPSTPPRWGRLAVAAVALLLTACGTGSPAAGDATTQVAGDSPLTVQNCGREVVLDAPPQRVVTIGAEAPLLVAAAGGADRLVALGGAVEPAFFGDAGDELEDVPRLSSVAAELSAEVLLAQEPDLVISINSDGFDALEAAGVPGLVISGRCRGSDGENSAAGSFQEVYGDVRTYGVLFGTAEVADAAAADLQARVEAVQEQFAGAEARSGMAVIYGSSGDRLGAYGGSSIAGAQIEALGITNVFADQDERFFEPNVEEAVDRDPDVLLLLFEVSEGTDAVSLAKLRAAPEYAQMSAVQDGRILTLPFALAGSSPGSVVGLELLAEQLAGLDAP